MARVKRGVVAHARHKKVLERAKGFRGRAGTTIRMAKQKVEKSLQYAYRDRSVMLPKDWIAERSIGWISRNRRLARGDRSSAGGPFPTDEAALKPLVLVLNRTEKEWTMPPRERPMTKAQFAVLFGERFTRAMA
jgi:transposase-like protein